MRWRASASSPGALILDCDGVIVESEEIHRLAYNDCWNKNELGFEWSTEFYERLQNTVGGGKEKMLWYFDEFSAWPYSMKAATKDEKWEYVRLLHFEKTKMYVERVSAGIPARTGIVRIIHDALERGVKVAVASAANGDAVRAVLTGALGKDTVDRFTVILAGDDVERKKPAPDIYLKAREMVGVPKEECCVIEDSLVGMKAAVAADLRVVITYTDYTKDEDFKEADLVLESLGDVDMTDNAKIVTLEQLLPHLAPARP